MSLSEDGRCLECDGRGSACLCGKRTVLVIDDDERIRRALVRGLRPYGWNVIQADSPHTAVPAMYGAADVVLSDWEMPHGGGARVLREAGRPVVIYTGELNVPPPCTVLGKPTPMHEIDKALRDAVRETDRIHLRALEAVVAMIDASEAEALTADPLVIDAIHQIKEQLDERARELALRTVPK